MGMDSKKLSARLKQPGHDQSYRDSESKFFNLLASVLDPDLFELKEKPGDLRQMLPNPGVSGARKAHGIVPEIGLTHRSTGRRMYFEVKKQGKGGNADERACKHHTVQFQRTLKDFTQLDYHPMFTVMCEDLATYPKYVAKHPYFFEADQYYCWARYDEVDDLLAWIERIIRKCLLQGDSEIGIFVDPAR